MVGAGGACPDGNLVVAGERARNDALVAGIRSRWRSTSGAYLVEGDVPQSTCAGSTSIQRDRRVIARGES